ncbi:F-box protein CPR1-like [Spinacia oleracea]|uniref:F-box protein CPR1-like n=1 Tax=Spinacia oleracea TaxID=3562 RepID=A0ABM3QIS1_SPIOL|nr:F-box protein CPR1-like [Spinacia oleracea]
MATLPIKMIAEILKRLPAELLIRFTIVCKSWNSLIKTPSFIKLHLNQTLISNSHRHILLSYSSLHSAELDLQPNHISFSELNHPLKPCEVVIFVGMCNGAVCISDDSRNIVFLYNPLTKSHLKLPASQIIDLNKDGLVYRFGFDSKSNDYKVLRMVQGIRNDEN